MTGSATAGGLLLATIALALAFLPRAQRWQCAGSVLVALAAGCMVSSSLASASVVNACLFLALVMGVAVYVPTLFARHSLAAAILVGTAGFWAGTATGSDGWIWVVAHAAAFAALVAVAVAVVARGWGLALRVVTSWVMAVAILTGSMPYFVAHPGYVPDHRE